MSPVAHPARSTKSQPPGPWPPSTSSSEVHCSTPSADVGAPSASKQASGSGTTEGRDTALGQSGTSCTPDVVGGSRHQRAFSYPPRSSSTLGTEMPAVSRQHLVAAARGCSFALWSSPSASRCVAVQAPSRRSNAGRRGGRRSYRPSPRGRVRARCDVLVGRRSHAAIAMLSATATTERTSDTGTTSRCTSSGRQPRTTQ